MKIFCGEYEIIDSGVITSGDLSDTKFVVSENPLMEIVFRISMEGEATGIRTEVIGESSLALVFTNPKGLGYGPASPVKVGTLNGRSLYVIFRVAMRGENISYTLEYTFYQKGSM